MTQLIRLVRSILAAAASTFAAVGLIIFVAPSAFAGPVTSSYKSDELLFVSSDPAPEIEQFPLGHSRMNSFMDISSEKVVLQEGGHPTVLVFPTRVPPNGRLVPTVSTSTGDSIYSEILVEDSSGVIVGAYDAATALDASGKLVPSRFLIEGRNLLEVVELSEITVLPVVTGLIYSAVDTAPTFKMTPFTRGSFVGVPNNYYYNPAWGALHDYCTKSPDEFPAPFAGNADFRGPCARHDLCYSDGAGTSKFTCDNRLWFDMSTNCRYQYGWFNPLRQTCFTTAGAYWAVVVSVH